MYLQMPPTVHDLKDPDKVANMSPEVRDALLDQQRPIMIRDALAQKKAAQEPEIYSADKQMQAQEHTNLKESEPDIIQQHVQLAQMKTAHPAFQHEHIAEPGDPDLDLRLAKQSTRIPLPPKDLATHDYSYDDWMKRIGKENDKTPEPPTSNIASKRGSDAPKIKKSKGRIRPQGLQAKVDANMPIPKSNHVEFPLEK